MRRLAVALVLLAGTAWAETPTTGLVPIPLHPGVNMVPHLAPDGSAGMVVVGWRDNGNAHGFHLMMVLVPGDGEERWQVARVEDGVNDPGSDTIADDPHTGEDVVRAVSLARGRIGGTIATLLLTATRALSPDGIPAPSGVTFDTYRLVDDPSVGTTPLHFQRIARATVAAHSCNAEMALSQHFGLPLPAGYEGPPSPDGCPTPPPAGRP